MTEEQKQEAFKDWTRKTASVKGQTPFMEWLKAAWMDGFNVGHDDATADAETAIHHAVESAFTQGVEQSKEICRNSLRRHH